IGRNALRTTRCGRLLFQTVRRRDNDAKARRILTRQPFDDAVSRLPFSGIEYLNIVRISGATDLSPLPVEYDDDVNACPILVIAQALRQLIAGERCATL